MKLFASLKTKMVVALVTVIVCLGILAAFAAMYMTEQAVSRIALKHTEMIVTQQETIISRVMADAISFAQHIGSQRLLIDYLRQPNPREQDPELLKYINGLTMSARYQAIYIMDSTGKTLVSTDPTFVGQNYAFRMYFQEALAGKLSVDAAIGVTSKKFGYYFSHPIKTESGEILGVVATKLREELVANALQPENLSSEGAAMLIDQYGVVIQSSRPDALFKSIGELTPEIRRALLETKRFGDINITSLHYNQIAKDLSDLHEEKKFISDSGFREYAELIGVARITGTPFFMMITEARQSFTQPAGNMAINSGLLVLMTALIAMGILITLMLWIVKPVALLEEVAQQIKEGGDITRIAIETGDEFEDIGAAFNMMADRVRADCGATGEDMEKQAEDMRPPNGASHT